MRACARACVDVFESVCVFVFVCVCVCLYMDAWDTRVCVCVQARIYVFEHVCVCVRGCVHECLCVWMHGPPRARVCGCEAVCAYTTVYI